MAQADMSHDWDAARRAAVAAAGMAQRLQSECDALSGAAAIFESLAEKSSKEAQEQTGIELVRDGLADGKPAALEYRLPDLGTARIAYLSDYPSDLASGVLDPNMMDAKTYFSNRAPASLRLHGWTLRCVPNPEGLDFAGWELDDLIRGLSALRDAMPALQAAIDERFPPEARA